jgi:biopolymer transport protein ExbB/TolQ
MDIHSRFLEFALLGSEWVLWLLVGLSVSALAIAVERGLTFRSMTRAQADICAALSLQWSRVTAGAADPAEALAAFEGRGHVVATPASRVVAAVVRARHRDGTAVDAMAAAVRARERPALEGLLPLLGTIGTNAPFVGLFGTVLDILGVFHQLGQNGGNAGTDAAAIMSGLSGALVATAMGLVVAIPAVALYNGLIRRQARILAQVDEVVESLRALVIAGGGHRGDELDG